jgi:hypothetical protein
MKLLAMITAGKSIERYLAKLGEPSDVPGRSPTRGERTRLSGKLATSDQRGLSLEIAWC